MSESSTREQQGTSTVQGTPAAGPEAEFRKTHAARARSALARAEATCRHLGIERHEATLVPKSPAGKAANAIRLSERTLASLDESAPDPAADARCARNAAAAATIAAQVAQAHDATELADAAHQAALAASVAALEAASAKALGRDAHLNAEASNAEAAACAAATAAGWLEP
ncbi:hypothetical protein [Streptomyces sp. NPDC053427]|uniref:hypothetical protein n=1 Tax=Streptomyces sp. NPDC053427 TaxID=3365701 RepID=UPI0037CE573F